MITAQNSTSSPVSMHDERFLYLYLSLMIAIFSIITMLNLQGAKNNEPHLAGETAASLPEGSHTLFGSKQKDITTLPLQLFHDGTTDLDEGAFNGLLFLLRSHDVNAVIRIHGVLATPEFAYGKALTLQSRLEALSFSPKDVRVEVGFQKGEQDDTTLTLFRF